MATKNQDTEARPKKQTREDLLKENGRLIGEIEQRDMNDREIRKSLSELLGSYEVEVVREPYSTRREAVRTRNVIVLDWLGVAFSIGELKGDADGNIREQVIADQKGEIESLKETIRRMEDEFNRPRRMG